MSEKSTWLVGILLGLVAIACQAQPAIIKLDSRATYLRTAAQDTNSRSTLPITLSSLGVAPGSTVKLTQLGDFNCTSTCGDLSIGMIAVFSSSSTLLAASQPHRVPGAIDVGVDIVTATTFFGALVTDIAQDFAVPGAGVAVTIPAGATHLFVAAHDSHYGDNGDPDGDFAVRIEQVPVANAGPDQSTSEGGAVTLDGAASTGANLVFQWQQLAGPAVTLSNTADSRPSFTAPLLDGGFGSQVLSFQLTVTSGTYSSSDTVDITVANVNRAPEAHTDGDRTVLEGGAVVLDGSASFDLDSDPLTYQWLQTSGPAVALTGADSARLSFTAPLLPLGSTSSDTLTFELTVSDGALSDSESIQVTVQQVNQAPEANAGLDQTKDEGAVVVLNGTASRDPDGDPVATYSWTQLDGPTVALSDPASPTPSFTAPATASGGATLSFALTVSDGFLSSEPDTDAARVTVYVVNVNDPPLCSAARASSTSLWPPNHKLAQVGITGVADPNSDRVQITINGVTQDEPVNGLGDGDTSPDAIVRENHVLLRAERSGEGNGRVYQISFTATDNTPTGGSCTGTVTVAVPHSSRAGASDVDDGQRYDATLP